jgi:uncharacterized integral membrane protein (TIGR00697 family)
MALSNLSGLTVYKILILGPFLLPAGIFTTPITYCLSNVTTEVYGYPVARNLMWWFIFSSTIFTGLAFILVHLPSPPDFNNQSAYELILGSMPIIYVAGIVGTIIGMNISNYLVSKFKIAMDGKHYWLRSIISTCGGEIAYNLVAYPIMLLGKIPLHDLIHIFISVTIFKMLTTAVFLAPECFLTRYLKIKEKINVFDHGVNYGLFKFKIHDEFQKPKLTIVTSLTQSHE